MHLLNMKTFLLSLVALFCFAIPMNAQNNDEVNPNSNWKFVRTNDVNLVTSQLQTFEFPAYRNFEYILNLEAGTDSLDFEFFIYDMQSQLISSHTANAAVGTQFQFAVKHNATYQIAVRVTSPDGTIREVKTLMSLLKRPKQ